MHTQSKDTSGVEYTLARDDLILSVGGRWDAFARENDAVELADGGVIGTSIWRWVTGEETKQLLASIFHHVRAAQAFVTLPYRCDAPKVRRYLSFDALPLEDGRLRLVHHILREEPLSTAALILERRQARSEALVAMCSWCCKIRTAEGWLELAEAVAQLSLLSTERPPGLTHTICPSCDARVFPRPRAQSETPRSQ